MKQKLLLLLMLFTLSASAQTISIVGTGVNGWPPDNVPEITLQSSDNVIYTIDNLTMNTGEVKFRQDFSWDVNWGSSAWPSGTATPGGSNIPSVAGTYNVSFNRLTGEYSFSGASAFDSVGIWGPAVDPINGFEGPDLDMISEDGVEYRISGYSFAAGTASFRINDDPEQTWGGINFPEGIAIENGPDIFIEEGVWSVYFNLDTKEYRFVYPSIGIIGSAIGSWDVDLDMATEDGNFYHLEGVVFLDVENAEIKFRQDDSWTVNWGGGGEPNVAVLNGSNIVVSPGTYDVTFNRQELTYTLTPSLSVSDYNNVKLQAFPNPTRNIWNITTPQTSIDKVEVYDVTGKIVASFTPSGASAAIDATMLTPGVYIARVTSGGDVGQIRLIRE